MKYELLNSGRGVLIDRTPILQDVKGTFEVSFLLPSKGHYFAVFIDSENVRRQVEICNGIAALPSDLLQPQYVQLYVVEIESDEVVKAWNCETIKISSLGDLLKSQWEISGGMSEASVIERLTEIERTFATQVSAMEAQVEKYNQAVAAFNNAIEVINNLLERVAALESNYDPTVIE